MEDHPEEYDDYDYDGDLDDLDGSPSEEGSSWPMVVLLLAAVALVGYVVSDGLESETYFYTVDQAVKQGDDLIGQTVRIKGDVEEGSIVGSDGELGRDFRIKENGESIAISYGRALPDTFEEDAEVVAEGKVDENYTLQADEVMVKCPSRYEGEEAGPLEEQPSGPRAQGS